MYFIGQYIDMEIQINKQIGIHITVADPGSEERGRLGFWGLAPGIF